MAVRLRAYRASDLETTLDLWQRAWDTAMPEIDFSARLDWWRKRWTHEIVPANTIVVAHAESTIVGFLVLDERTGYLDQIVVEPSLWGNGIARTLLAAAKRRSPRGITLDVNQSNFRAIRFYEREGFVKTGEGANPLSGRPTWRCAWKP